MFNFFGGNKKVTEQLYQQNLELAVKNKTLSLLEELYQTSVLTLLPREMAGKITDIIQKDLNLESAGVLVFEKEADILRPLAFSRSERLQKALEQIPSLEGGVAIKNVSQRKFYKDVVYAREDAIVYHLADLWEGVITPEQVAKLEASSGIKTVLLYPLIAREEVFAVLKLDLNRDYQTLNSFEKSSIRNFINIVALLLDKAYLYKNLQDSYEVTKKAYAVEKQAKEELENLDKTKNEFMMVTQHHLRTPLTSMMGYIDLIETGAYGKVPVKMKEVIHKFGTSSQDLIKIVNDFLDASQFSLGKKVVVPMPNINVELIVKNIVEELQMLAKQKGLKLDFEIAGNIPLIEADANKLQVALTNIFHNSVKYTQQGSVSVNMSANGSVVEISSRDTGIGMAKETIDSLFTSLFSRGKEAKSSNATGSGVGLYLSYKIIQAHGGKVWAESEGAGKGSTFHVELPIVQPKESMPAVKPVAAQEVIQTK